MKSFRAEDVLEGRFEFLGRERVVGLPRDWATVSESLLWIYNLQYFEYVWSLSFAQARQLVLEWIKAQEQEPHPGGWDPYPLSLRTMNWCAYFFGRERAATEEDDAFRSRLWLWLARQGDWLLDHLEYHLMGNHLLENAMALTMLGSCFRSPHAERWMRVGSRLLRKQMSEQVLADGVHIERSPMYQARLLLGLELLAACAGVDIVEGLDAALRIMTAALECLTHPDGQPAQFNDTALGEQPSAASLRRYLDGIAGVAPPGGVLQGPLALPSAGYYGYRSRGGEEYVICDAGKMGPDWNLGHGHADVFSFELSLGGRRVIVDSGISTYEDTAERRYERSTEAHNTVTVGGHSQAELWGAFRAGRRPNVSRPSWRLMRRGFRLLAVHDGYAFRPLRAFHRREFEYRQGESLVLRDEVEAPRGLACVARLHFHPDCSLRCEGKAVCLVECDATGMRIEFEGNGRLSIEEARYSEGFGRQRANRCVAYHFQSDQGQVVCRIVFESAGG